MNDNYDNLDKNINNFDNNFNNMDANYDRDHSSDYENNYGEGGRKKLKDIIMPILLVIIVILLVIGGCTVLKSKKSTQYSDYENELAGMGTDYSWLNSIELPDGTWRKITFEDLQNNLLLSDDSLIVQNCEGYVILEGINKETTSKAYISCGGKYTTEGYGVNPTGTEFVLSTEEEDTLAPSLALKGYSAVKLDVGGNYIEYGAIAIDNKDGDISGKIITTGTVDTKIAGKYTVTYTVSDTAGNKSQITRVVIVKATKKGCDTCLCMQKYEDSEPPVITLQGDNPAKVYKGTTYKEQGYTAYDNEDGDITDKVVVTVTEGLITYTVTDSAGNTATVTREIQYIDKKVIVKKPSIVAYNLSVCVGKTANVSYRTSNISSPKIKYSLKSGSNKYVSLSGKKVKGIKKGTAYVIVKETSNGISATAKITVKTCTSADPQLKALYETVYIPVGTSFTPSAIVGSNTQVCSAADGYKVDIDKNFTIQTAGSGTIVCTSGGRSVTLNVVVFGIKASDVTLKVGETTTSPATVMPESITGLGTLSYKSDDTGKATVSSTTIKGMAVGNTKRTITFTLDTNKLTKAKVVGKSITVTPNITVITAGGTTKKPVTLKPAEDETVCTKCTTSSKNYKSDIYQICKNGVWIDSSQYSCSAASSVCGNDKCCYCHTPIVSACYRCGTSSYFEYVWTATPGSNCTLLKSINSKSKCNMNKTTHEKCLYSNSKTCSTVYDFKPGVGGSLNNDDTPYYKCAFSSTLYNNKEDCNSFCTKSYNTYCKI